MRPAAGFALLILAAVALAFLTSRGRPGPDPPPNEKPDETATSQTNDKAKASATTPPPKNFPEDAAGRRAEFEKNKEGAIHATMEIDGKGTLTLELYPKATPKTVAHFVELAKKGFYDGLLFHRVVADFVAQGGDPQSKKVNPKDIKGLSSEEVGQRYGLGGGGSGANVPAEWVLPHIPNSIGLARSSAPDSGDSQFYFNLKDNANLDGQYCVFGLVTGGTEILPKIEIGDRIKHVAVQ